LEEVLKKSNAKSKKQNYPLEHYSFPLHPALIPNFGYCFTKSALKFRKMLSDELEAIGIQLPHQAMMIVLGKAGPMNQISIGDEMGIDKATMVKLIDQLEESGFVRRNAHSNDRRVKVVELTAKGHAMLPKMAALRQKVESKYLSSLSKSEANELRRLIIKLVHASAT
jgi:DNA-binding MarR family transcriptional regulator